MTHQPSRTDVLIKICESAIDDGDDQIFDCPDSVIKMEGMSSKKCRCFLNSIGRNAGMRYIEIGTWKGSTLFSAAHRSMEQLVSIDNWSEFGGPRTDFEANCKLYENLLPPDFRVIEKDFRNIDETDLELGRADCLFYDGQHTEQCQRDAMVTMPKFMHNEFICLVDDYAWPEVRNGTQRGIKDAGLEVVWEYELPSKAMNDPDNYWNGILVAVLRK